MTTAWAPWRRATAGRRTSAAMVLVAAMIVLAAGSAPRLAQAQGVAYRERPDGDQRVDGAAPGRFEYYVLALSWSPTYCADVGNRRFDAQCQPGRGRRYAFVLHGLWPQYERGWPQYCASPDHGYVPRPVANRMRDIMPSDKLIFNEYRKHGTCSGLGVDGYFELARRLYDKVTIPKRFVGLSDDRLMISPAELVGEFVVANPGLRPDMIAVECGGSGHRLREVRICFDREGRFRACGGNENRARLCPSNLMYVPPVRAGAGEPEPPSSAREILPLPRDDRRF